MIKKEFCLASGLILVFLLRSGSVLPLQAQIQQVGPGTCPENREGTLDPRVLQVNTEYLDGLIAESALKNLLDAMWKGKDSNQSGLRASSAFRTSGLLPLFVDPSSIQLDEESALPVFGIAAKTRIQFYYEGRPSRLERDDPRYTKDCPVLRTIVATPPEKAKSIEVMLEGNKMIGRFMEDLEKLEVVSVPDVRRDKNYASCKCLTVNTLTIVPRRVFDSGGELDGADIASFSAGVTPLRKEKQSLEKDSASLIKDLRVWQFENSNPETRIAEDTFFNWAGKEKVERWLDFWNKVREATEKIRREDERSRKVIPGDPNSAGQTQDRQHPS
jgi:hypothetical protein